MPKELLARIHGRQAITVKVFAVLLLAHMLLVSRRNRELFTGIQLFLGLAQPHIVIVCHRLAFLDFILILSKEWGVGVGMGGQ